MSKRQRAWALFAALASACVLSAGAAQSFDEHGYRIARYRAPIDRPLEGGTTVDTDALVALIDEAAPVLVDVQALSVRAELEAFGIDFLPNAPRYHLPGSVWWPNVGRGTLDPRFRRYFQRQLWHASGGDRDRAMVFYCVIDCWMSWNAVRRAAHYGYRALYWYPGGSDGWDEAGLPLVEGEPVALGSGEDGTLFAPSVPDWRVWLADARANEQAGVLLFFETDDCPYCRRMRAEVLNQRAVIERYRERWHAVAVDARSAHEVRGFSGAVRATSDWAAHFRATTTPTLVFIDTDGEWVHREVGLIADPQVFLWLLDYIDEHHYTTTSFRDYTAWRHSQRR